MLIINDNELFFSHIFQFSSKLHQTLIIIPCTLRYFFSRSTFFQAIHFRRKCATPKPWRPTLTLVFNAIAITGLLGHRWAPENPGLMTEQQAQHDPFPFLLRAIGTRQHSNCLITQTINAVTWQSLLFTYGPGGRTWIGNIAHVIFGGEKGNCLVSIEGGVVLFVIYELVCGCDGEV